MWCKGYGRLRDVFARSFPYAPQWRVHIRPGIRFDLHHLHCQLHWWVLLGIYIIRLSFFLSFSVISLFINTYICIYYRRWSITVSSRVCVSREDFFDDRLSAIKIILNVHILTDLAWLIHVDVNNTLNFLFDLRTTAPKAIVMIRRNNSFVFRKHHKIEVCNFYIIFRLRLGSPGWAPDNVILTLYIHAYITSSLLSHSGCHYGCLHGGYPRHIFRETGARWQHGHTRGRGGPVRSL